MMNCCNCYRTDGKRNDCYYHIQAMTATLSLEYAAIVVSVLYRMLTFHSYPMVVLYLVHQTVQVDGVILWFSYAHVF